MKAWLQKYKQPVLIAIVIVFSFILYLTYRSSINNGVTMSVAEPSTVTEERHIKVDNKEDSSQVIMVDVKGAVNAPDVYVATEGQRVIDLINKAGGFTSKADSDQVNLSQHIEDEMVIYVPILGETANSVPHVSGGLENQLININKSTETELQTLPGIGPSKAKAIIAFREENGGFKAIEDLKNISGIGEKTFEKLAPLITVK